MRGYEERCASYYAQQYGVSPALVRAIIQIESAWQRGVVSSKCPMGLMQLMPATAQHFGVTHPFYIHENVRGGVAYLAELQALFHGDFRLVMAAYAAGEKPILARGLDYSSEEVYTYVQRVAHSIAPSWGAREGDSMNHPKACIYAVWLAGIVSAQTVQQGPTKTTPAALVTPATSRAQLKPVILTRASLDEKVITLRLARRVLPFLRAEIEVIQ